MGKDRLHVPMMDQSDNETTQGKEENRMVLRDEGACTSVIA